MITTFCVLARSHTEPGLQADWQFSTFLPMFIGMCCSSHLNMTLMNKVREYLRKHMRSLVMNSAVIKFAVAVVISGLSTLPAASQARVNSLNLSCSQAKAVVKQRGVVIMSTGSRIYERVVSNRRYCEIGEQTEAYRTSTADTRSCNVGKKCKVLNGRLGN